MLYYDLFNIITNLLYFKNKKTRICTEACLLRDFHQYVQLRIVDRNKQRVHVFNQICFVTITSHCL